MKQKFKLYPTKMKPYTIIVLTNMMIAFKGETLACTQNPHVLIPNGNIEALTLFLENNRVDYNRGETKSSLVRACQNGQLERVGEILAKTPCIDQADKNGCTPLFHACSKNQLHIVSFLLSKGANPNITQKDGASPLHIATQKGHVDSVKRLMSESLVEVDSSLQTTKCQQTALWLACWKNHPSTVSHLLSYSCHQRVINMPDYTGITPLMIACHVGNDLVVQILLNAHADINAKSLTGLTALDYAHDASNDHIVALLHKNQQDQQQLQQRAMTTPPPSPVSLEDIINTLFQMDENNKTYICDLLFNVNSLIDKLRYDLQEPYNR